MVGAWGIHDRHRCRFCADSTRVANSDRDSTLHLGSGEPGLHVPAAASLHGRCVPAVQLGDSGYRPRQNLHDPAAIPAQPRLPGLLQTRTGGPVRRGSRQHEASAHPKVAQAEEAYFARRHLKRAVRIIRLPSGLGLFTLPRGPSSKIRCPAPSGIARNAQSAGLQRIVRLYLSAWFNFK